MRDPKLNERIRNFQSSTSSLESVLKHREKVSLTLRKEKLYDKIMDKRLSGVMTMINEDEFTPVNDVLIPQESLDYYNNLAVSIIE